MALVLADRVQETSTSTGTGAFTLDGAVTGYQSFAVIGNGNTTYYTIADQGGANWEVGIGTYTSSGTSLSRDTVLSSSNSGSLVPFTSGTKTVFVTYPSSKSVNLSAAGNVSALGTVTSGTWQGSTVGVAYGGTGVTSSSGANSVVLRDANQNITINRLSQSTNNVTAAGGTTTLTAASAFNQTLNGTGNQTFKLPDATTLTDTTTFQFNNNATGTLTITDYANATVGTITSGGAAGIALLDNSTVGGTWDVHAYIPENVTWGTNSLTLGSTVITGGTWQGGTVQPAYGGTGLTTFTGANNALYSTGATTLTAGTLPVAAGGTGVTTSTGSGNVVLSTSPTLVTPALGTPSSVNLTNATNVPVNQATGTLAIANGGTGQTTAGAAFNALSPITTTGDLIVGNGANSATRLGIGSTGQVLTVSGGTATWVTPTTGGGTITRTDFTATAGQTVFTVSYTVGLIDVYRNGVKLATADFTATNGTSFTLAVAANAGDIVQAEVFSSLNLYSTITYQVFNGDGTTTVFTMNSVPANTASLLVAISGVVQDPGTYTVSSTTLTFLTAPPAGTGNISVRYLGIASVGTVGSFSAGTTGLTPSSATTGAVVLAGTLNVANGGTGLTSLTANRIPYGNGTSAYQSSANLTFDGTTLTTANDASISGLTVGKGGGAVVSNTAVGNTALASNTTGSANTIVGYVAGNGTFNNGTAVGYQALGYFNGNTGTDNTAIGKTTLYANSSGAYNTAIGSNALYSNTTASYNTAVGYQALYSNTTASYNSAFGRQAGYSTTTGTGITAIGTNTLTYNTTGSNNTAVGGTNGVSVGAALEANTTGSQNVAVGTGALNANTTASSNTAVGYRASYFNTTGTQNCSFGQDALYSNTTGSQNCAFGYYAMILNTTGGSNTAIGREALYSNTTASNNTAVGYQAGYSHTSGTGGNTFLGRLSGYSTTGNDNTFVGNTSGYSMTTGTKNTIIGGFQGNQGGLDIRTASNYIVLSDGDGNPRIYHDGAALRYFRGLSSSPSFDYVSQSYKTISKSVTTSFLQIDTNSTSSSGLFCNFEIMYLFDDFGQNIYTGRKTYRLYNDSGGTVQLNLVSSEDYGIAPTLSIVRNSTFSVTLRVNTVTTASTYGWMYRIRILAYNNATSTQTGQILTFTEV